MATVFRFLKPMDIHSYHCEGLVWEQYLDPTDPHQYDGYSRRSAKRYL